VTPDSYKADFDAIEWSSPMAGVRHKVVDRGDTRLRLVEYSQQMPPHWCARGHHGYVLEGEVEIEYQAGAVTYRPGDGIMIPDGQAHSHRARAVSDHVLVVFVEKG
jgi:quercetin dioxygenase-like cupin family protein